MPNFDQLFEKRPSNKIGSPLHEAKRYTASYEVEQALQDFNARESGR